jgi:hypothetical protein
MSRKTVCRNVRDYEKMVAATCSIVSIKCLVPLAHDKTLRSMLGRWLAL